MSTPWRNYLIYLVILTSLTTVFSFSRYVSTAYANEGAKVAKFDVQITGSGANVILAQPEINNGEFLGLSSGMDKEFPLRIVNNGEVSVEITCEVIRDTNYHIIQIGETGGDIIVHPGETVEVPLIVMAYTEGPITESNVTVKINAIQLD